MFAMAAFLKMWSRRAFSKAFDLLIYRSFLCGVQTPRDGLFISSSSPHLRLPSRQSCLPCLQYLSDLRPELQRQQNSLPGRLMTGKTDSLTDIPPDRALKLNADGAGNYRVEYDDPSWKLLVDALPKLSVAD